MIEKSQKHGHEHDDHEGGQQAFGRVVISRIAVAVCGALVTWFDPPWPVWLIDGLAWAALAYAAWPIFSEAIHHLRNGFPASKQSTGRHRLLDDSFATHHTAPRRSNT